MTIVDKINSLSVGDMAIIAYTNGTVVFSKVRGGEGKQLFHGTNQLRWKNGPVEYGKAAAIKSIEVI